MNPDLPAPVTLVWRRRATGEIVQATQNPTGTIIGGGGAALSWMARWCKALGHEDGAFARDESLRVAGQIVAPGDWIVHEVGRFTRYTDVEFHLLYASDEFDAPVGSWHYVYPET